MKALTLPAPIGEPSTEYVDGLRERCLRRTGYDRERAEALVRATLNGWIEADQNARTTT